jgi:predicted amidophosphoribosyltransferase
VAKKQLDADDFCPVCGDPLLPGRKFCSEGCANLAHEDFDFYFKENEPTEVRKKK